MCLFWAALYVVTAVNFFQSESMGLGITCVVLAVLMLGSFPLYLLVKDEETVLRWILLIPDLTIIVFTFITSSERLQAWLGYLSGVVFAIPVVLDLIAIPTDNESLLRVNRFLRILAAAPLTLYYLIIGGEYVLVAILESRPVGDPIFFTIICFAIGLLGCVFYDIVRLSKKGVVPED